MLKDMNYAGLIFQMMNSPGYKIRREIEHLENSNYIFSKNCADLIKKIKAYERNPSIWDVKNRSKLDALLKEITRLLHNYSTSVLTLIDHTKNFRERIKEKGLEAEFNKKVEELRINEIVDFMKDFRQHVQHYALPPTGAIISVNETESKQGIIIKKEDLLRYKNWRANSKKYLKKCDEEIEIKLFCENYRDLIKRFYAFFYKKVRNAYSKEFIELQNIEEEISNRFTKK